MTRVNLQASAPRLAVVALIVGGVVAAFVYAAGWLTPAQLTPKRMIDAFERANGQHPGFRRNHAKGLGFSGYFESNGQGRALSKAAVFQPGRVPVIGRFALPGGMPFAADTAASVRSMALRFTLPDGEEWRTGMNDIPVFPTNTPQAFYEQLIAGTPNPATGKPDPALMAAFLAKTPSSARAMKLLGKRLKTAGFQQSTFNSLNAFRFQNAAGEVTTVRWSMVPVSGERASVAAPTTEPPAAPGANYLFDDLAAAVQRTPLRWHLIVVIAQPGDRADDATVPFPPDRKQLEVGTLTIDHVESEDTSPARDINFDPLVLPDGMTASDDPLLSARSAAYSESFTRREGEPKIHSAVPATEVTK
ncbi:MAG: catalase family peroxidase [Polyangiaceae bacterium]